VTWTTSVPILIFLGLFVLDLGPMYATDRQASDVRRASSLNAPYPRGGGKIILGFEAKTRNRLAYQQGCVSITPVCRDRIQITFRLRAGISAIS